MHRLSLFLCLLLFTLHFGWSNSVEEFLNSREDLTWEKAFIPKNYEYAYKLRVKQPIDHSDTTKGFFYQTVFLNHKDKNAVNVLITEGYERSRNIIYEITKLTDGNQVTVEHRFFGESIPDSLDYRYLNLEQATADLHRITEIMKGFYTNSWLSSGISKGGQTTIFYRYFYPEDMNAWIPYVAPFNLSLEDERIYHFFDTIGTKACRDHIKTLQLRLLKARDTLLPLIEKYAEESKMAFNYLNLEEAFEYTVLEYPFSFWQWGYSCSDLPDPDGKILKIMEHVFRVCDISFFADQTMKIYGSHYYQAGTEMGYYGYEIEDFKKNIKALPTNKNPLATFPPDKMPISFNDSLVTAVNDWLVDNGNNMIYIYGGIDTWSATMIPPSNETNSIWFVLKGKSHSTARINEMNNSELDFLVKTLNSWLGTKIKTKKVKLN
jgi:hypothetical protein